MKKITALLMSVLLVATLLVACGNTNDTTTSKNESNETADKLKIVCSTFPQYDWVKQILGDKIDDTELSLLIDNGVDLHSYQPSADDVIKVANADLFIYVGGESDGWVDDALAQSVNDKLVAINLVEELDDDVYEEEAKEGMEAHEHDHDDEDADHDEEDHDEEDVDHDEEDVDHDEEDHDDEDADHDEEDHDHEHGIDEHIWLSVKNASTLTKIISEKIAEVDAENAEVYNANAAEYIAKLDALDDEYEQIVESAKFDTVVFGDRFPFRYLIEDYDLDYYAAFIGCSAETEASFETIAFLAGKVDELGINNVLTIEGAQHDIAKTVINNTQTKDQGVLVMNSMQAINATDIESGVNYLQIMQDNAKVLESALN